MTPGSATAIPVTSPWDGAVIGGVDAADEAAVGRAVAAGRAAFAGWGATPVKDRVQVLFRFKALVERDLAVLAELVSRENGKTPAEAEAEIRKGLETVEFATALPHLGAGRLLETSTGVDTWTRLVPLGVVAGITPFNFPAMVPMWMFPIALACGNAFLLKPSELVPLTPDRLGELLREAGLPAGVFQVVQGGRETVEVLVDHPGIEALAFVGSTPVAQAVHRRGALAGKRVLALGGAKNHLVVLPDADPALTASNVVVSMAGCAGQRCMAASVLIAVGNCEAVLDRIVAEARAVRPGIEMGAVISAAAKERIEGHITRAAAAGARLRLDGRGASVAGKPGGWYVGPTILDGVAPDSPCAREEIFGPVLAILRAATVDEAVALVNRLPFGNAAAIYTRSGGAARAFAERVNVGMVGINVGVPVPREPFSFGGWNQSRFGAGDITGDDGIRFWTKSKKVTARWPEDAGPGVAGWH